MKRKNNNHVEKNGKHFHKEEEEVKEADLVESDEENGIDSDADSDIELQQAFAKNLIKPGLNTEVPDQKKFINNQEALKRKYKDVYLDMDWIERLDITVKKPADQKETTTEDSELADNDFKREHSFFLQAQSAVLDGLKKLHTLGVPTQRPIDYYAEMAKSDSHMKKVKEVLLSKEAELEKREKIRKLRELKKIGKKVQVENLKKKLKDKKDFNNSIEDIKKGKSKDTDVLGDGKNAKNVKNKRENNRIAKPKFDNKPITNKKRKFKDTKFGFGGRKKRSKYNTKESASGFDDYNARIHGNKSKPNKKFQNKNKPKQNKMRK